MMKVKDVFRSQVKSCTPLTSLDAVGRIMWENECGAVPVVDAQGKAIGILTDRDLAMAMAAKNRGSSQILVRELTSGELFSCVAEDDITEAIRKMRLHRVRRLPVIDAQGQLAGILSLKDLALAAKPGKGSDPSELSFEDIALTLQAVSRSRIEAGERVPQWPWVNASAR
jgi:CBS domain-containing protein